jgi:hypothetical protein
MVFCLFRFNQNVETLCFGIEAKQPKKRFVSDSAETCFDSSFGCFESKLVSKDTLAQTKLFSWGGNFKGIDFKNVDKSLQNLA